MKAKYGDKVIFYWKPDNQFYTGKVSEVTYVEDEKGINERYKIFKEPSTNYNGIESVCVFITPQEAIDFATAMMECHKGHIINDLTFEGEIIDKEPNSKRTRKQNR